MKIEKKVMSNLTKCYSIAPLHYQGRDHILVAAEKQDPCYLFDLEGNLEDKVWDGPGGAMSMVQVPGTDGQFLSTSRFYSPNDSKDAKIVIVTPKGKGDWEIRTLVSLPHVHRFDLLSRDGDVFLIACTLKSGHDFKDDWTKPGKVYAAKLPGDLSGFNEESQLKMTVLRDNMQKNHGYCRIREDGYEACLITSNEGVFRFVPPARGEERWEVKRLLAEPSSDAVLVDFDGDGRKELGVLAPFHGDQIFIYKERDGAYEKVYTYAQCAPFAHAVYGGDLCGTPAFVVGHRKGERNLIAISYDRDKGTYVSETIDRDCGPANVFHYVHNGKDVLVSANRETNQVAMYTLTR